MKNKLQLFRRGASRFLVAALCLATVNNKASAQCSTGAGPTYSSSCTSDYYTSITASGTGVTSTIAYSGASCVGTYFNYYASQGITAAAGSTVSLSIARCTGYTGYITVYVDWNNNGIYTSGTELAGTMLVLSSGTSTGTYNFTIPTTGIVAGVNLHMRVMLSEVSTGAPCTANYGEACDYYIKVTCPPTTITATPASGSYCIGSAGVALTASGAGVGGTYTWSPTTGLSSSTGASVTAAPPATTTYTITGTTSIGCTNTVTATVTANPTPSTTVSASGPLAFCTGGSVTLTAPAGSGYTYQWYNGSIIPGATDITYTATTSGNYTVVISNSFGCTATSTASVVTVSAIPVITITAGGPTTFCAGSSVGLTATGAGAGGTYTWLPATGLSSSAGATVTASPAATTDYTVTGTTSAACSSTTDLVVSVNPAPSAAVTASGPLSFCAGGSVILTAPAASGYTYQWYNGALIPGATSISYTATTSGNYTVIVSNSFGCSTTSSASVVTVSPLPTISVTATGSTTLCSGSSVSLTAAGAGAGGTYSWSPATGLSAATGATVTASPSASTIYTVTGTTSPAGCSSTASISVTVNPTTSSTVSASGPLTFCMGGSVTLTAPAGAGYLYQWYNGAAIPGATGISYTTTTSGNFTVVVSNGFGCSTTSAVSSVVVNPLPSAVITPSGPTTFCDGGNVALNVVPGAGYTYQWYNSGLPVSGATNATLTATVSGDYTIVISDGGTGCSATSATAVTVNVNPVPTATATASGPLTFCSGSSLLLSASTGAGYIYQWYNGATAIAGATNSTCSVSASGSYDVIIAYATGCSATSAAFAIVVNPTPVATITLSGPATFCTGGSVTLNATAGAGFTYQWSDNSGPIAGATNAAYTATTTSNYTINITSTAGCSAVSLATLVTEVSTPVVIPGDTAYCSSSSLVLSTSATGGTGLNYQWNLNGSPIPGATYSTFMVTTAGFYSCTISIPGSCSVTTAAVSITIHPAPVPSIAYNGVSFYTGNFYPSYQWYENSVAIAGATSYAVQPHSNGSYRVRVVDNNGCAGYSPAYIINTVGVRNIENAGNIKVYPNPANNIIHIESPLKLTATIMGMDGRKIIEKNNVDEMDISSLPNGVYILDLYDEDGNRVSVQKITKN